MSVKEQMTLHLDEGRLGFHATSRSSSPRVVRVLDFMEAAWVGGPAKNLIEFARRSASVQEALLRPEILVATFHRGGSPTSNEFIQACERVGLNVHSIQERCAFDPAIIPALRKLIAWYDPEIIQTHSIKSHFLVRLAGVHRRRCWIAFHHGYTWTNSKVRILNYLDRWSLPQATQVITVCRPFASALEGIGVHPERIAIRHNSVNTFLPVADDKIDQLRRSLSIPIDAKVLLSIGRLSREKGQADLIEALGLLRRENSGHRLRLIVVGDGPDRGKLREIAKTLGLADWVIFVGHQGDVAPYYTMADLIVLPSHTEGSPNTLLEAMSAGVPIVATAVGGVPEIVTSEKEALLVEKHRPAALARAIERVLRDESLQRQLSAAARSTVSAYSPDVYYNFMLAVYDHCLIEAQTKPHVYGDRLSDVAR